MSVESGLKIDINLVTPHLGANDVQAYVPKGVIIVPSSVFIFTLKTTVLKYKYIQKNAGPWVLFPSRWNSQEALEAWGVKDVLQIKLNNVC